MSSASSHRSGCPPVDLHGTSVLGPCRILVRLNLSGGYAVCDPTGVSHRTPNCHCLTSFVGVVSRGRCTIAEVVEMDKSEYQQAIERLVCHFVDDLGAPTLEAARAVAEEEATYTAELCDSFSDGVWITVERTPGGDGINEHYSVFKRLMIGGHKL